MSSQQSIKILYIDDTYKITDVCILIKKYYFPLPTSKTILFEQIEKISLETALHANHKWGPNYHDLNNWFPLDKNRGNKTQYVAIHLKNKKIVPSISPLYPTKVYNLLKEYFCTHGLNNVVFEDNLDQENHFQDMPPMQDKQVQWKQQSMIKSALMDSTSSNINRKL